MVQLILNPKKIDASIKKNNIIEINMSKGVIHVKIIDVHAHILPGLDDGSSDEEKSMEMIKMAESQGITTIIATPHYSHYFQSSRQDVLAVYEKLMAYIKSEGHCTIQIYTGQEILYSEDVPDKLAAGELMTLADSRYVLIEFLPFDSYSKIFRAAGMVAMAGYRMILAHAERYECLRDPDKMQELLEAGVKIQMNYRPIGGKWYNDTTRWCRKMLKEGNIHFLGTDMHNMDSRKPDIKSAVHWMTKHLDEEYMQDICYRNAEQVLNDKQIKR